jgi:hypothetical protein
MIEKRVWQVKCPRCKKMWEYRDDRLHAGPKYKYCRVCSDVEANTGHSALRGKLRGDPRYTPVDED